MRILAEFGPFFAAVQTDGRIIVGVHYDADEGDYVVNGGAFRAVALPLLRARY